MNQDSVPDIKAEIRTEEDILVPQWIKTEIKKEEDDLHVDSGGFICPTCEMRHDNEESFIQHVQQHHSTSTRQEDDNLSHIDNEHQISQSGGNPHSYKCSQCSYSARQKSHLVAHHRTHSDKKLYQCTECSYSARTKSHLVSHQRIHSGE